MLYYLIGATHACIFIEPNVYRAYHVHTFVFETIIITFPTRKPLQCHIYALIDKIQSKIDAALRVSITTRFWFQTKSVSNITIQNNMYIVVYRVFCMHGRHFFFVLFRPSVIGLQYSNFIKGEQETCTLYTWNSKIQNVLLEHKIAITSKRIQIVPELAGRLAATLVDCSKDETEATKRSIFGIILTFLIFPSEMTNPTKFREMLNNMRIITYIDRYDIMYAFVYVCVYLMCQFYSNISTLAEIMVYRFYRIYAAEFTATTTKTLCSVHSRIYAFENIRYMCVCVCA